MHPDEPRFMPSEVLITRPHDAPAGPWEDLGPGRRVLVIIANWPAAAMRVTGVIAHADGGETYVLRDPAVTDAELEAERAAFTEMMRSAAVCGACSPGQDAGEAP